MEFTDIEKLYHLVTDYPRSLLHSDAMEFSWASNLLFNAYFNAPVLSYCPLQHRTFLGIKVSST